jgi:hypothetical protein
MHYHCILAVLGIALPMLFFTDHFEVLYDKCVGMYITTCCMTCETQLSERGHFCSTGLMACSLRGGWSFLFYWTDGLQSEGREVISVLLD